SALVMAVIGMGALRPADTANCDPFGKYCIFLSPAVARSDGPEGPVTHKKRRATVKPASPCSGRRHRSARSDRPGLLSRRLARQLLPCGGRPERPLATNRPSGQFPPSKRSQGTKESPARFQGACASARPCRQRTRQHAKRAGARTVGWADSGNPEYFPYTWAG